MAEVRAHPQRPYGYRADATVPVFPDDRPILVFDGHCALCSGLVRFVIRHDRLRRIRFVPAQSKLGGALYRHYGLDPHALETNIVLMRGRAWFKLAGALRLAEELGRPWSWAALLRRLPHSWQDALYDGIARNRTCHRPDPIDADRFLG
ncbi:DUF393 domain-containing protein [Methylobacterium sp. BTF04]|nr:DCC1-like thiol-disulfide oxidoreductase family protein [Methylobacterium sp. BTF04]NEU11264.1 DUF393 domain-containing protein [Methylobacterium sp. BTF04]